MPTISLCSFLKILSKGTPQKVQEYTKYLTPGGYDFYWSLKEAAHAITVGGESFSSCAAAIEDIPRDVERKHNLDGVKALQKWLQKNSVNVFFAGPAGTCTSPAGHLVIKLEPEFGYVKDGKRRLVQIWNSKGANLTRVTAGVGIYLLQTYVAIGEFADCSAGILDLRKRNLLVSDALPPNVEAMVRSELAWVDSFFAAQKKAA